MTNVIRTGIFPVPAQINPGNQTDFSIGDYSEVHSTTFCLRWSHRAYTRHGLHPGYSPI